MRGKMFGSFVRGRGKTRRRGFTIIEFVIVVGMMAALAGIFSPMFYSSQEAAREARAKTEVDAIASALRAYYSDFGHFKGVAVPAAAVTFTDLVNKGYLPAVANDPWGTAYSLTISHNGDIIDATTGRPKATTTVSATSLGPDKAAAGDDDIVVYVMNIP